MLKLRTKLQWLGLSLRARWRSWLARLLFVVSAVLLVPGLTNQSVTAIALGLVTLVASAVSEIADTLHWRRSGASLVPRPLYRSDLEAIDVPSILTKAGYMRAGLKEVRKDHGVYSHHVNVLLYQGADAPLQKKSKQFPSKDERMTTLGRDLRDPIRQVVLLGPRFRSGAVLVDEQKVRLETDLMPSAHGFEPVTVRPTRYFETMRTNDIALTALYRTGTVGGEVTKDFSGRDLFVAPNGTLRTLSASPSSNHVGTSTLAFTNDGALVLTQQGRWNAQEPLLLAPSGSGSADWEKDAQPSRTLRELVLQMTERELSEECGIDRSEIEWTQILGFARVLHRGGKPEFFCVSRLSVTSHEIRKTRPERLFVAAHDAMKPSPERTVNSGGIRASLMEWLEDRGDHVGRALRWNLHFLDYALQADPELEGRLLAT